MISIQKASKLLLAFTLFIVSSKISFSQKFVLTGYSVPIELPSTVPQCKDYSTYDFNFISLIGGQQKELNNFDLPYETKFSNFKRTTEQGDFHVIAKLFKFSGGLTSKSTAKVAINLTVKIFDRTGKVIGVRGVANDAFFISMGRYFTEQETNDPKLISTVMIQNTLDTIFKMFDGTINGTKFRTEILFADLNGVKKIPELSQFYDHLKEIARASTTTNAADFNTALATHVPYWEKMTTYVGEGDSNEVRRAAFHNLSIYNILTAKLDKATEYINRYKLVDRPYSMFLGLGKQKYSDDCEKKIMSYYPNYTKNSSQTNNSKIAKKEALIDLEKFLTINGTIKLNGKRHPGNFTGIIKISNFNAPPSYFGSLVLEKQSDDLFFEGKDEAGNAIKFSASSSDLISAKDNNGDSFIKKSIGGAFGIGGQNALMKNSYSGTKITVYRSFYNPEMEDFFIVKTGDVDGLKSLDSKSKKKLLEYLSDCVVLSNNIKDKKVSEDEKVEKLAALYNDCN
jgi:hypothetical protein